ncbi:MAG TPA: class I SAM-dependent methyltransferase [Planctomycetota bacterium]|jgi:SAM-dependent methyltransferase|nr:class I SAM-dependent methyltransferase [Planctomycetota bacterium]
MGHYTRLTRSWLDARYRLRSPEGIFRAHAPIYGFGSPHSDPDAHFRIARALRILRALDGLRFETLLEVGGGEGYLGRLVRRLFGARVLSGDLSAEAGRRAFEFFGLEAAAFDAARLPFRDAAFDVVVCSEVIEHVEFPVETLLELDRVAGGAILVTSQEFRADRGTVEANLAERRDLPHAERNFLHPDDLRLLLGAEIEWSPLYRELGETPSGREAVAKWVPAVVEDRPGPGPGYGGFVAKWKDPRREGGRRRTDAELLRELLDVAVPARALPEGEAPPLSEDFRRRLDCPFCGTGLAAEGREFRCGGCRRRFPSQGGVPLLLDLDAPDPTCEELGRRLRALSWQEARAKAVLALRERLQLPDGSRQMDWDFSKAEDRSRWFANDQLAPRAGGAGVFSWRATGPDPWIVGPLLVLPAGGVGTIEVEMRVANPDYPVEAGRSQVFWLGEGDLSFGEGKSALFTPRNDGEVRAYRVPVGGHPGWPRGEAGLWIRFDPLDGPGEVDLHRIRLLPRGPTP